VIAAIDLMEIIWGVAALAALLLVAVVALLYVRKRFSGCSHRQSPGFGFTLDDLRRMRREGEISDKEYNLLKEKL
jgi:uncharacterized membrane protein